MTVMPTLAELWLSASVPPTSSTARLSSAPHGDRLAGPADRDPPG